MKNTLPNQLGMLAVGFALLFAAGYVSRHLYSRWRVPLQEHLGRGGQIVVGCLGIPGTLAIVMAVSVILRPITVAIERVTWLNLVGQWILGLAVLVGWMFFGQVAWRAAFDPILERLGVRGPHTHTPQTRLRRRKR